ncbi:hypothetical protein FRACYDRAFT_236482 [Fragilariopsis cylindrus CCMP1102]|uniref:Transmembrane protein n=1 Tax=Fragilariopsis cylindrus CCMP1102 TaxID=635003 RepID=A0A1E7FJ61_9STRA|nr:hypothetical protein FRACYDRAFT_236482 [Fragilariopsis cylindrus CCMP1102]|eukprot:OEU18211.1 hypothetical protein FRACYDRAFT_236482 [Fragilariopsis cylindrus CCMP1102]
MTTTTTTTTTTKDNDGIVGVSDDDDVMMMVSAIPNNNSNYQEENMKINHNQNQNPRTTRTTRTTRTNTRTQKCKVVSLLVLAFGSITLSILTIYSCNFFSYRDITSTTDGFTEALLSNNRNNYSNELLPEYMYSPFEYLNEAGVGLFAYNMGNPSSSSVEGGGIGGTSSSKFYKQDPMCFLYCDELNDFKWFFNNYNHYNTNDNVEDDVKDESSSSTSRRIDLWILARYCSIFAPCIAILGIIQLLIIVFNYYCCGGWGVNNKFATKCLSKFLLSITFVIASAFQFGTFTIMFASPQLSSFNKNGEVIQEQFCTFSSIESTNGIKCRFDSGAWLSLGAGIGYFIIALLLLISILFCKTRTSITTTTGNSDSDSNNKTNTNTDDSSLSSEEQDF